MPILLSIQADIARDFAFSLHCKIGKLRSNVRWSGFLMVGLPGFVSNFSFCPRFFFRLAHFLTMVIILVIICCGHHEIMSSSIFPWSLRHCSHGHHPENDDHGHHPDFGAWSSSYIKYHKVIQKHDDHGRLFENDDHAKCHDHHGHQMMTMVIILK